jgi:quercetin dioxygenase-like cupin family protein
MPTDVMPDVQKARYFDKAALGWLSDATGSNFWSVALERVQLTYFEVPPGARFEMHRHYSEQITMVLEGELRFELEDEIKCVGPGEVIALPAYAPHAVTAGPDGARAIDAWSPPNQAYTGERSRHDG